MTHPLWLFVLWILECSHTKWAPLLFWFPSKTLVICGSHLLKYSCLVSFRLYHLFPTPCGHQNGVSKSPRINRNVLGENWFRGSFIFCYFCFHISLDLCRVLPFVTNLPVCFSFQHFRILVRGTFQNSYTTPLVPAANGVWPPLMLQLLRRDYFGPNSILEHFSEVINSCFFYLEHLDFNHGFTSSWLLNL